MSKFAVSDFGIGIQGLVLTRAGRDSGTLLCSCHPFTGKHAERQADGEDVSGCVQEGKEVDWLISLLWRVSVIVLNAFVSL
jgi:hypothetical protein